MRWTIQLPARYRLHYWRFPGRRVEITLSRRPDPKCCACHGLGSVRASADPEDGETCPECAPGRRATVWPIRFRRPKYEGEAPF